MDKDVHTPREFNRRTLAKGALWTAPAIVVGAASPSYAISLRKDPGINGWVNNYYQNYGSCYWRLEVDSQGSGPTPDGAPFGLYLYDIQPTATVSNASLTYWVLGDHSRAPYTIAWTPLAGHSSCWRGPTAGAPRTKSDGMVYTPYTWNYTCPILASDVRSDGRLYLGNFHVIADFYQPSPYCNKLNFWTQRTVTVDQDGSGPQAAQTLSFERRNGTDGSIR